MFTVTNASGAPRIFTDRWGVRQTVEVGQTRDDLDLDAATGEYIAELQEFDKTAPVGSKTGLLIEGEADTSAKPRKERQGPKGAIAQQTLGDPVRAAQSGRGGLLGSGLDDQGAERAALDNQGGGGESGGGQTAVKRKTREEDQMPTRKELEGMTRKELDKLATGRGLDPKEYANKEALVDALAVE